MPFGNVAHAFLTMHLDMVPGLLFGRAAAGHDFIPLIGVVEFRVDTQNHPVVIEFFVMDQLSDTEFRFRFLHGCLKVNLKKHSDGAVDLLGNILFQGLEFRV